MAFVDLNTKKIYGCKEGGYVWNHEKGHIEFHEKSRGAYIDFWKGNVLVASIAFVIFGVYFNISFFKSLSLSFFLVYFFLYIYEEVWCWVYALKNKK